MAAARTFPPSGDAREDATKTKAGYVEYVVFSNQGGGYFCGTCRALCAVVGKEGFCQGLRVPVKTYGCCNNWNIAPRSEWLAASGRDL